jgi:hypothetical protein
VERVMRREIGVWGNDEAVGLRRHGKEVVVLNRACLTIAWVEI